MIPGNDPYAAVTPPARGSSGAWNILIGMLIGVALTLVCLAVGAAGFLAVDTRVGADCKSRSASLLDVLHVQTYAPGVFSTDLWTENSASYPDKVTRTWYSDGLGAVAHLEYLVYNCEYTQANLDTYFSDSNFKTIIFSNYQDVANTAQCSLGNLQLHEFTSTFNKNKYVMYYWIQPDGKTRVLDLMLTFPIDRQDELQTYAERLYPTLPVCK